LEDSNGGLETLETLYLDLDDREGGEGEEMPTILTGTSHT
jgi:hypothetical protein